MIDINWKILHCTTRAYYVLCSFLWTQNTFKIFLTWTDSEQVSSTEHRMNRTCEKIKESCVIKHWNWWKIHTTNTALLLRSKKTYFYQTKWTTISKTIHNYLKRHYNYFEQSPTWTNRQITKQRVEKQWISTEKKEFEWKAINHSFISFRFMRKTHFCYLFNCHFQRRLQWRLFIYVFVTHSSQFVRTRHSIILTLMLNELCLVSVLFNLCKS